MLDVINPVVEIYAMARTIGAVSLVDGAQSLPHFKVDVQSLGCDFFTFSGQKIFVPTCIGVPYGRRDLLDSMSPWQGGDSMIKYVLSQKQLMPDYQLNLKQVREALLMQFVSAQRLTFLTR